MLRRPFFSMGKPKLGYMGIEAYGGGIREIPVPGVITLMVKGCNLSDVVLKPGVLVKTGERMMLTALPDGDVVSTVTGEVTGISAYRGYLDEPYVAVTVAVSGDDVLDDQMVSALAEPSFEGARDYLSVLPGKSDFRSFLKLDPPVNTVVVMCMDEDLLVLTRQQAMASSMDVFVEGIEYLKQVARVGRVVVVASSGLAGKVSAAGVDVMEVSSCYPAAVPGVIAKDVLGMDYLPERGFDQMGIGFISAEAVVSLGRIFGQSQFQVDKLVTVVGKDGVPQLVKVRIGTLVKDIFSALGMVTSNGDRVVMGGPMRGEAIYSEDMPVMADTDAILLQDQSQVDLPLDGQCINCGECIRACPVDIPVNMLVRVLSKGLYEDALDYDLHCCIECGLCSYVCVGRIPIFHYIMLGKHELAKTDNAEGSNA